MNGEREHSCLEVDVEIVTENLVGLEIEQEGKVLVDVAVVAEAEAEIVLGIVAERESN